MDLAIRATARTLADVMVADPRADSGPLRQKVGQVLETMANDDTLMRVGQPGQGEYRLQTTESALRLPTAPPDGAAFDGQRWNGLHYTCDAKRAARGCSRAGGGHG